MGGARFILMPVSAGAWAHCCPHSPATYSVST